MTAMHVGPERDGHEPRSFEVYADALIGGIRESDQEPDGMVFYADIEQARSVLKARLRQAKRVEREQKAWKAWTT